MNRQFHSTNRKRLQIFLWLAIFSVLICIRSGQAQQDSLSFFEPAETFSKSRFWTVTGIGVVAYTGTMIGLNELWYKKYPRGSFHFFNDWKEWNQMDKAGHLYTTYFETVFAYKGVKWAGIKEDPAIWIGAGVGMLLQSSVEFLDGFSTNWGFSVPDFTFNILGASTFIAQQKAWGEQRMVFKVSSTKQSYDPSTIQSEDGLSTSSLERRTDDLYGSSFAETFLKDYNAQTVWASFNIASILKKESRFPKWLNIAFGYGAENMFGGFENTWEEDGHTFVANPKEYPRLRQYYISPDIDLTRIPTKSHFLKTVFTMLNIFKIPAPALEWNSEGRMKFHLLHY